MAKRVQQKPRRRVGLKEMGRRGLSMLMAMIMVISLIQISAFAADNDWQVGSYQGYDATTGQKNDKQYQTEEEAKQVLEADGVTMQKNISAAGTENLFNIDLIVTTQEQLEEIPMSPDAAVVLVIDASNSMNYNDQGCGAYCKWYGHKDRYHGTTYVGAWEPESETRLPKAKAAAAKFVDDFTSDAGDAKRMISVVTFNSRGYIKQGWTDSASAAKTAINGIRTDSDTNIEAGLQKAYDLLGSREVQGIKSKYVILLTDGAPTTSNQYHFWGTTEDYAKDAAAVAQKIRTEQKATLYTLAYSVASEKLYGNVTVGQWLENDIASNDCAYNATSGDEISISLDDIMQTISKLMQAWQVNDPMGTYMKRPTITSQKDKDVVTVDNNGTILWNLWLDTTQVSGSSPKTYTYTLSYQVELDTTIKGFQEDSYYETNKPTTLKYAVNLVNDDGSLNVGADVKTAYFNIPTVKGEIPEYAYKVEYYKEKTDGSGYELADTTNGSLTDLWTVVDIKDVNPNYEHKYDSSNYHYVKGDPASITISAVESNNVIKLYYDRDEANVTVNHFYKTDHYAADGTFTEGKYPDKPQTSATQSGYVGDKFTATKAPNYNGALYDFDKGDDTITVKKDASQNVINLYYTRTEDDRADASVVVNHVYRTHTWTLENGKYVLKDSVQNENNVESSTGLKATTTYTAQTTPAEGFEGFTYDDSSENSITLKPGENVITLYFDKTVDDREEVQLTVNHHYTKTVVTIGSDGKPVTTVDPDNHVETVTVEAYKGETVTISEQNTYNGEFYPSDSGNAAKLTRENVQNSDVIDLYYAIDQVPETTFVTVNHIYRTITHETVEVTDPVTEEVIGTEVKDIVNIDDTVPVTVKDLYVGQSYTAEKQGRPDYTFNEDESDDLTDTVKAGGATIIDLYYDKDEDKDDRDAADIDVMHVYTTHLTTIVDGEVKTIDVQDGFAYDLPYEGKTGDTFTATPNTTFNQNEYSVVGNPDLEVVLQPGTNDTIVINYERSASNLVDTTYTVNYVYNTYTMVVENGVAKYGEPSVRTEDGTAQNGYVGQVVTIKDGAEEDFTAAPTNPATSQTLKADGNVYTFVYNKYVPLNKVNVTVNHHYTTTTITVDGTSSTSTEDVLGTPVEKYVGEDYVAVAAANGFNYDRYTVTDGITATQDETTKNVTVTASGDVVVDFYYSKTVDNSKPVNYTIQHVYVTINWDGTRSVSRAEPITGSSFATKQVSAATDNNNGNYTLVSAYFNNEVVPGFDPADPKDTYAVTLVDGENAIVYTYERHEDNREASKVKVIHNYYARDTYTVDENLSDADYIAQEGIKPEYRTENVYESFEDGIWVGNEYTATMYNIVYFKDEDGNASVERVYDLVNATPEGGKIAGIDALVDNMIPNSNVVTFNLIRDYSTDPGDTTYTVVHEYYTNGNFTGSANTFGTGKVGATVNAADITKVTIYDGNTYTYSSASADSITLAADGSSTITLRYDRTTGGGGGDTYYNLVVKYLEEGTDEELAPSYTARIASGRSYDVTAQTEKVIDGYVFSQITGDAVTGYMNGNREIIVYYTVDIDDGETPLDPGPGGDGDGTDIGDGEVPLDPGPGGDGDGTDIGDENVPLVPATGDNLALWVVAAVASAAGLVYLTVTGKKREKDNA